VAYRALLLASSLFLNVAMAFAQEDTLAIPVQADSLVITGGVPEPAMDSTAVVPAKAADTLDWRARHSPHKASILSAVLPGAGQIYNRKYWKAPIVWAGLGTCVYFIQENSAEYRRYKDAYIALVDGDPTTTDEFNGQFSAAQVLDVTDTYRRWRDLSYIAFGLVYMLNIVDAGVDANFVHFDVSRDLSLNVGPSLELASRGAAGLSFSLALR
jgi:hypothetical protein